MSVELPDARLTGIEAADATVFTDANETDLTTLVANVAVLGATTASFLIADETKLDGIATSATANPNAIDNLVEDATPQLGGDLDANGNDIQFDTATGIKDSNGLAQLLFALVASAVNFFRITNAATGNDVKLEATGTDTNVGMNLVTKAAGRVQENGVAIPKNSVAAEWSGQQNFNEVALTDAATVAWDLNTAQTAVYTLLANNRTMGAPTNMNAGSTYVLRVVQSSTTRTITWNAVFKWPGGTAPVISTGNADVDEFFFTSDGTNMYGTFAQDYS